ncbi:MFS transporter [Pseudonocardia broussonetiae]|uniref:MHS family MFS transporter n=1 Tax=Pseudonocardia broussonetiae TaxID=2736640 RepID=A0A6M6JFV0_9PSEU|nr:MFS transporter [Pseudonocardia broussonetiae]QJY46834.1 MHS family MFS transporter [Pseudonocardia broussonetiae]
MDPAPHDAPPDGPQEGRPAPAAPPRARRARLAAASFAGSTLEYYDFFIYGTASALVLGPLFFPGTSPLAGTLLSFATFAVGFLARPVGAVLFGALGDRLGRRTSMIWSIAVMGVTTFLIGCLPTYETLGAAAPLLLVVLRLLQGVALGGEWGGASLMMVEHAPAHRRGLYGSVVQMGVPGGLILSALAMNASQAFSGPAFAAWGWRLPFLFSVVLLGVSLYIRLHLEETPVFTAMQRTHRTVRAPLRDLVRTQWRDIGLAMGVVAPGAVLFFLVSTYAVSYGTSIVGMDGSTVLTALLVASVVYTVTIPLAGWLSDVVSRRAVLLAGCLAAAPSGFLLFGLLGTGDFPGVVVGMTVALAVAHAALQAPQPALFASRFDARVRFSGVALSQSLATSLLSGPAPILAALFFAWVGSSWLISAYVAVWAAVGAVAVVVLCRRPDVTGGEAVPDAPAAQESLPTVAGRE